MPDHSVEPQPFDNEEIRKVLYADGGDSRIIVTVDDKQLFRIYEEHWNILCEDGKFPWWCRNGPYHFTDSFEHACKLAEPLLA